MIKRVIRKLRNATRFATAKLSQWCFKKAGFPVELHSALLVADPGSILASVAGAKLKSKAKKKAGSIIGAGASVAGAKMQSDAQKRAAETAARAQREAAQMQRQTAQEALGFSREQFEYGQEQDAIQRAFAEQQRQVALQQLDYENRLRQSTLQGFQPFADVGLGSLPGLTQMAGTPTMAIDPSLYEMAGMQQREATPIQAFDPTIGAGFERSITDLLGQRHLTEREQTEQQYSRIMGLLDAQQQGLMDAQLQQRREREAQAEAERIRQQLEAQQQAEEVRQQLAARQAQAQATARAQVQPERVDLPLSAGGAPGGLTTPALTGGGAPGGVTAPAIVGAASPVASIQQRLADIQAQQPTPPPAPTPQPAAVAQPTRAPAVPYRDSGITAAQLINKHGWRNVPQTTQELQKLGYSPREAVKLKLALSKRARVAARAER